MSTSSKIFIAGHQGMVGSAIVRYLRQLGFENLVTITRGELDLRDQLGVQDFFAKERVDQVYLAAARVGGIFANNHFPAEFIYDNLMIQSNVIDAAFKNNVQKLMFLGSSCIYPKMASQPMAEDVLFTGPLEPTNEPYAIAKIAGIKLCESYNRQYGITHGLDYRCVMPTNLYGKGDNYHQENAHVIPALIRRFHEAKNSGLKKVVIWGDGSSMREFLYVDDLAAACVYIMNLDKAIYEQNSRPMLSHINIGYGKDVTIKELAQMVGDVVGYKGGIVFDTSKPNGAPKKQLDSGRLLSLGWRPCVELLDGLKLAYADFQEANE